MHKDAGKLIVHAHLFTMKGDGVGYVADGAVAVQGMALLAAMEAGQL